MTDDSLAVMVRPETAYRIMRLARLSSSVDDNFFVAGHYVRGECQGYVVVKNDIRMTEDQIKPFIGN